MSSIEVLNLKSQIDEKRLEQELIYYAEKLDLTEEKVRLKEHCSHFMEILPEKEFWKKTRLYHPGDGRNQYSRFESTFQFKNSC